MYAASYLYLAKQWAPEKVVEHYAIIGPGRHLGFPRILGSLVLELMAGGPRVRHLGLNESWTLQPIQDVVGACKRIRELSRDWKRHEYDALGNNCEHWARYIASGVRRSEQVRGILIAGILVAGLVMFCREGASA